MGAATERPIVPLSYARARFRWKQRAAVVTAAVLTAAACWAACAATARRARLMYWQHECMRYAPPAGEVAYVNGAPDAPAPGPASWARFAAAHGQAGPAGPAGPRALVFLHRRRAGGPGAAEPVVAVYARTVSDANWDYRLALDVEVIEPATFTRPAVWRRFDDLPVEPATYSTFADSRWAAAPAVKTVHLFRGRPDDEDPSRFLIPYDLDGRPGVVAGRLHSDGTVTLIVAGGPDLSRCYVRHVNVPPDDNSGQFMLPSDDLNGF